MTKYRRRGKIRWANYSWFQPYEVFCGALATSVDYLPIAKNSQENFHSKFKNHKSLIQRIFPCLRYDFDHQALHTSKCSSA